MSLPEYVVSKTLPEPRGSQLGLSDHAKHAAALRLLREALRLLDESDAPPEFGAQLDQVIVRLERFIHGSMREN